MPIIATAGVIVNGVIHLEIIREGAEKVGQKWVFGKLTWEGILWDQHSRESSGKSRTQQLLLGSPAFSPGHSYLFSFFCMWPRCVEEAKPAISRSLLQVLFQWSNFRRSRSHFQPEKENISNQKSIFNLIKYFQSKNFQQEKQFLSLYFIICSFYIDFFLNISFL